MLSSRHTKALAKRPPAVSLRHHTMKGGRFGIRLHTERLPKKYKLRMAESSEFTHFCPTSGPGCTITKDRDRIQTQAS